MSRVLTAVFAVAVLAALPTAASAGCYTCYAPPQPVCGTCGYQQQVVPPQYRTVDETVMVSPGRTIAHRTPAQYRTVMVPRTVMVAPEGVEYEQVTALFARFKIADFRHGRACPGHLRLACLIGQQTWMPGTRPGMTSDGFYFAKINFLTALANPSS